MCNPLILGLATFGMGAAQSVMQFMGERETAKAERDAAKKADIEKQNNLTLRQVQESQALAQKKQEQNIEEAVAISEVEAGAAARGVGGISVDNLLTDVQRRAAYNRRTAQDNHDMTIQQMSAEKKGSARVASQQINNARGPSPLSLVAGVGGAALGGYNTYSKAKL